MHARGITACGFLILICVFLAGSTEAQPPSVINDTGLGGANAITGTVLAAGQRAERRISVRLQTSTRGDRVTTTDDSGSFAFRGLPSGDYTIVIDKEKDFEPYYYPITVIQVRGFPPQLYNLSVRLTLKAAAQPKPGIVIAPLASLPDRAQTMYGKALDLAKAGDHKAAIEQLSQLTAEFPTFMLGHNELGVNYLKLNQPDKADAAFQEALKIEPEAFAPTVNRGIALFNMRRFTDAETVFRKARKMNDQSAVVHYFLGQALANLGQFDEAEKELVEAVRLGGEQMKEAHRLLAIIYSSKGGKKKAAEELETYLRVHPNAPDAERLRETIRQMRSAEAKPTK
jgi:tetratricopeptide (TPR) repeat protein